MHSVPLTALGALAALGLHGCSQRGGSDPLDLQTLPFEKYFNYGGDLTVQGLVSVRFASASATIQNVRGGLRGVDPACQGVQDGTGNRCGVHVHEGESCSEDALGHFFNTESDPWVPVTYTAAESDADGPVFQHDGINTGATYDQMKNKVVVVHDSTGARIACAKFDFPRDLQANAFQPYFNYAGGLTVQGEVNVHFASAVALFQNVGGALQGIDPACQGVQDGTGNRCGIHVHAGESCSEDALGHFFNTESDPWVPVTYTTAQSNADGPVFRFHVDTGATYDDMKNKVVVVHDSTGARIACSKLTQESQVVAASETASEPTDYVPGVLIAAVMVIATLGGWTYYQRSRRSYGVQQDEAIEVEDAAPTQDESMQDTA